MSLGRLPLLCGLLALLAGSGVAPPAFALGGDAARPDSALKSHLVMVLSRQANRHGACTGTVIAPDIILTAAHCVAGNKMLAIAYPEGDSHILQRVADKAVHPGYSGKSRVSVDLALVRLEGALPARFSPLSLDTEASEHSIGQSRLVAGYGLTSDRAEASGGTLRSASVLILPKIYPRFMRIGQETGATLRDLAICTGDSGGPVLAGSLVVGVVYGREKYGAARDCGVTAQAVRLAPQRDWIEGVLARWRGHASGRDTSTPRRPLNLMAR